MILKIVGKYLYFYKDKNETDKEFQKKLGKIENKLSYENTSYLFYDTTGNAYTYYGFSFYLEDLGISHDSIFDMNEPPFVSSSILKNIELFEFQRKIIEKNFLFDLCIDIVPTGGGKTEIILGTIAKFLELSPDKNILVVLPNVSLMYQFHERALERGFSKEQIGLIGDDHKEYDNQIIFGVINSLYQIIKKAKGKDYNRLIDSQLLVFDECHHVKAESFKALSLMCEYEKQLCVSGTPFKSDDPLDNEEDALVAGLCGKIIAKISNQFLISVDRISQPLVYIHQFKERSSFRRDNYNYLYKNHIIENTKRNNLITNFANKFVKNDFKVLIFVTNIEHGIKLLTNINSDQCIFVKGNSEAYIIDYVPTQIKIDYNTTREQFNTGIYNIMIATQVFDEGVDMPNLDVVILAGGGKSEIKIPQRVGRGSRMKNDGINCYYIIDFYDTSHVYFKSQSKKRMKMYEYLSAKTIENEQILWDIVKIHSEKKKNPNKNI